MKFHLTWYEKVGDRYLGERILFGLEAAEVRKKFQLQEDEYPGDCLGITENHVSWLSNLAREVSIQLSDFDYFLEARQS